MLVTLMQFFEFLIWLDQPSNGTDDCSKGKYKGKLNNVVSQISSIQNLLQPLFLGVLSLFFIPKEKFLINQTVFIVLITAYFISVVSWVFKEKLYKKTLCTIPCSDTGCTNHHLQWQWIKDDYSGKAIWIMYFIFIIITSLNISKIKGGLYLALFLFITFIISSTIYPFKKSIGSWWCVSVVIGPLIKLLLPTNEMYNNVF